MSNWLQIAGGLVLVLIGGAVANAGSSTTLVGVIIGVIGVLLLSGPTFIGKKKE